MLIWRRSYDTPPPALDESDPQYPGRDVRYKSLPKERLPKCESLKVKRCVGWTYRFCFVFFFVFEC